MGLSKRCLRALTQWAWPAIRGIWSGKDLVLKFSSLLTILSSSLKMLYTSSAFSSMAILMACDGEDWMEKNEQINCVVWEGEKRDERLKLSDKENKE